MAEKAYFLQECPTCGRTLHVRVEYLGRKVVCQHCGGRFLASDGPEGQPSFSDSGLLLRRASELIDQAEQRKHRASQ